ncbi:MutS domain V [Reichenbachiella faecimaris]|uniref:MutS domain V n=1 Tax=Reichenbachiella faecimaris TaxID=692418 RepID=A0A1W2GDM3_REIFA|nr:hypothetical protein [Reichenbachiella faecimaris]SMD34624.1 MutS domain V [Reichenbachiella faecimaris]
MFSLKKKRKVKPFYLKSTDFDFDRISLYFKHSNKSKAYQVISDGTCKDLDFEELFMYLDRTSSVVGQQYLYAVLRTLVEGPVDQFEKIIEHLNEQPKIKKSAVLELNKLNSPGAYYLQRLIYGAIPSKPKWFSLLPILSGLSVCMIILSLIYPTMILGLLLVTTINSLIHYWNKNNVVGHSNTIPQLMVLTKIAKNLVKLNAFNSRIEEIKKAENELNKISVLAFVFKWESKVSDQLSQVFDYILDFLKGIFLIEPIFLFSILGRLDNKRQEVLEVFEAVSALDVAISISAFRQSLPNYAIPHFTRGSNRIQAKGIFHPLTIDPVVNDIDITEDRSMLITGSNMSGKSTLIRAVGINVLLAQTINTVCCESFDLPNMKIFSAIRVSDNLVEDTSYYYAEVKKIKELLEESTSANKNLFLLDELFKGTNTIERIASAKAVLSYLNQGNNYVFAATHDVELTEYLTDSYDNYYFSDTIENGKLSFDYLLKAGTLSQTNAIRILELNGFPSSLTQEAQTLADEINNLKNMSTYFS